jgi:long-chain acyl-CoA synthetase
MLTQLLAKLEKSTHSWWMDDARQKLSPSAFVNQVCQRADALRKTGGVAGQRRLIVASETAEFFLEMCATWEAGGICCPVEPGLSAAAIDEIQTLLAKENPAPDLEERVESTVLLTSGSTGARKGVRLTSQALFENAQASVKRLGMTSDDHLMINIPFHFTSAICHFLACLVSGARFTAIGRPLLAKDLVDRVRQVSPTGFGGAPLQARWLADGLLGESSLGWLMTSGDDLPASSRDVIARNLPQIRLHVFYGLTEVAGRFTSLHPDDHPQLPGSVGRAIDGLSVEVLDEAGKTVAPGEFGEVHASGRTLMIGYVGQHESLTMDGRFPTGDIGWLDSSGYLYLAGRSDDVFKVSGNKVSGLAVRETLLRTGLLADAFVIPMRQRNGLVVSGALIVPSTGSFFDLPSLRATARANFDSHALPREYVIVDAVPRTGSGKPDRRAIDQLLVSCGWQREHGIGVYAPIGQRRSE